MFDSISNIEKNISSRIFLLKAWKFIDRKKMTFRSPKEAQDFLILFLVSICISEDYSRYELRSTYRKIKRYVRKNRLSGDIPVSQKRYMDELDNVEYTIIDSTCSYNMKKPAV